ncbi:MAG: DUF1574 family protein [Halobacteriovoraceae bacterium]|nr:DUF1574 family protein [Halobacteriovoraceae bacterium]
MKNFSIHILCFTIAFFVFWVIFKTSFPIYFKGYDIISWQYKLNEVPLESLNDKIVVLGDSATEAALDPTLLPSELDAFNFSLPGGNPFDGYVVTKRLFNKKVKPRAIVVIYSVYNYMIDDGFIQQNLNYNLYTPSEIKEVIEWQRKHEFLYRDLDQFQNLAAYFPYSLFLKADGNDGLTRLSYLEYYLSKLHLSLIDYNRFKRFVGMQEKISWQISKRIKSELPKLKGHINYQEMELEEFIYPPSKLSGSTFPIHSFSLFYTKEIIRLAKENNVPVLFAYSPVPEVYYERYSKDFEKGVVDFFNDLAERNSLKTEENFVVYPQKQFADQVHLNPEGSKAFTKRIENFLLKNL